VQRNNEIMEVDADAVVVGDIILVKAGNKIAADGRVIHASGLKVRHKRNMQWRH
jgi:magnesium-transporting ATPase (P-type)